MIAAIAPVWVTARAAGIAALLAASLAASLGLLSALRPDFTRGRRIELTSAHEALSLATFALIAVHGVALALDPFYSPGVVATLVPLQFPFKPVAVALGQVAGFGMVALGATFYVRKWIGAQRWRRAHRFAAGFWALAVLHGLLAGSDAGQPWFLIAAGLPVITAASLLAARAAEARGAPSL